MSRNPQDTTWYRDWFGSDYLLLYQHRSAQEARQTVSWLIESLKLQPPCRVLDLACGPGRHALEFARRSFETMGLDLSWPLLNVSRRQGESRLMKQIRGDMRRLPLHTESFGLVLSLFTSFGYFRSAVEDASVLKEVCRILKLGGIFVLDFLNASQVRDSIVPQEEVKLGDNRITIRRWVDETENRVKKMIRICDAGQEREYLESVYLYGPEDLALMFDQSGLSLQARYGNYRGAPYEESSPRLIMVGRKGV